MKKVIAIILMILCGFTVIGGGTLLLTSCGTSTQQSGGGISDSGEIENPDDDENNTDIDTNLPEDNPDEDVSDSEDDTADDDDKEIEANLQNTDYTFKVIAQIRTSSTSYTTATASTSSPSQIFSLAWMDNGTRQNWGADEYRINTGGYYNVSSNVRASYFYYNDYDNTWFTYNHRYGQVNCYNSLYALYGISTSSSWSNTSFTSATTYAYFWGRDGGYTLQVGTSRPTSYSSQISNSNIVNGNTGETYAPAIYLKFRRMYNVSFNANGGSGSPAKMVVYAGRSYTLPSTIPTRSGYIFKGWSTSSTASSATWSAGGSFGSSYTNGDKTLFAVWQATYSISYALNSGSWASSSHPTTANEDEWFSVSYLTRTGYTFLGWTISGCDSSSHRYGTSTASYSTSTSSSITHNITRTGYYYNLRTSPGTVTFSARWEANTYTLTINIGYEAETEPEIHAYISRIIVPTIRPSFTEVDLGMKQIYMVGSAPAGIDYCYKYNYTYNSFNQLYVVPGSLYVAQTITTNPSTGLGIINYTIRFSGTSNDKTYYFKEDSQPTAAIYDHLYTSGNGGAFSYSLPARDTTINLYFKERLTVSYNTNNGTGSVPSSQTSIYGGSVVLGTNNLTRSYYTANGWNLNAEGTSTHYSNGVSYSVTKNTIFYADWNPITSTVNVQIKTSTNGITWSNSNAGGSVTVTYYYDVNNRERQMSQSINTGSSTRLTNNPFRNRDITFSGSPNTGFRNRDITFSGSPNTGYIFLGVSSSSNSPPSSNSGAVTTFNPASPTATVYVYFNKLSNNQLKYDSTDRYWYFEDGKYPQSYVGNSMNSTLINSATASGSTITYFNGTSNVSIPIYTYGGNEYARLRATRAWRVSEYGVSSTDYPDGWDAYGSYKTNFTVVSDRVLMASAVTNDTVSEGWAFTFSELFSNMTSTNSFVGHNYDASTSATYYRFGNAGQQDKVTTVSRTENGLRVATASEIGTYLDDYKAYASDMVCFLLGIGSDEYANYWTRTLGTNLGNGKIITSAGMDTSSWLDNMFGVRFAMTMREGSRV